MLQYSLYKKYRKTDSKYSHKIYTSLTMKNLFALLALLALPLLLASCNVTRKVTTQSEYVQRGDTSVVIMTKTIESYDATKKIY